MIDVLPWQVYRFVLRQRRAVSLVDVRLTRTLMFINSCHRGLTNSGSFLNAPPLSDRSVTRSNDQWGGVRERSFMSEVRERCDSVELCVLSAKQPWLSPDIDDDDDIMTCSGLLQRGDCSRTKACGAL